MLIIDHRRLQHIRTKHQHRLAAAADPHSLIAQCDLNSIATRLGLLRGRCHHHRMPFGNDRDRFQLAQIALLPLACVNDDRRRRAVVGSFGAKWISNRVQNS